MFGIGMQELIIIVIIALLVVGPKKLPDVAKTLGKGFSEFRNALDGVTEDFKQTIQNEEKPDKEKPKDDEMKDSILFKKSDAEESQTDLLHKTSDK
jgi:sec-independent protein translocase protein TatA